MQLSERIGRRLKLRDLNIFLIVAKERSMSKAATQLGNSEFTNFDDDNSCVSGPIIDAEVENHDAYSHGSNSHRIRRSGAYEAVRLRRNGVQMTRDLVSAEMLAELEAAGDAIRFVDAEGRIAWKATPSLCQCLMDLQLDAEADLEDV